MREKMLESVTLYPMSRKEACWVLGDYEFLKAFPCKQFSGTVFVFHSASRRTKVDVVFSSDGWGLNHYYTVFWLSYEYNDQIDREGDAFYIREHKSRSI